ncbi:MAG: histidinol-phosphatase HisJ family protein [Firmicutes bacterium]|nr:histidinol-phosphatase HisJ family protein [Bacillota bacterium]
MEKIDTHTHTYFSVDGKMDIFDLVKYAVGHDYSYIATTEHLDGDYLYCVDTRDVGQIDLNAYRKGFNDAKKQTPKGLYLAFGIECGYCGEAVPHYRDIFAKTAFDVIINSVHSVDGTDIYISFAGEGWAKKYHDKKSFYLRYLEKILESARADYPYHILGHIGYAARYIDFSHDDIFNPAAVALTEEILFELIKRGKTLEINAKGRGGRFIPNLAIVERYYKMGGRDISFGSDAHTTDGVGLNFEATTKILADIGFDRWTVYVKGEKRFVGF